jgi:cobalt-precorrin 5A hydrolase
MEWRVVIVAGFGFRKAATVDSFANALESAWLHQPVERLATARDKACAAALVAFARRLSVPVVGIAEKELGVQKTLTQSAASIAARNIGSVAEAAALAAAGNGARLIVARVTSADGLATCALAEGGGP